MALNDDNEENIEKSHKDLCLELNMDTSAATASWDSYNSIRENCTLEVNFEIKFLKTITASFNFIFFFSNIYLFKKVFLVY